MGFPLYSQVVQKFLDKGYLYELHIFVPNPPMYNPCMNTVVFQTAEENYQTFIKVVNEIYSEQWDYWNIWIDYQQYKF